MKAPFILILFFITSAYAQVTMDAAKSFKKEADISSYSYHEKFLGYSGYAAPIVLTSDGGAILFGDDHNKDVKGASLVKLDKEGKESWRCFFQPAHSDIEAQSVVEDANGNFYAFILSYNSDIYRGGSERVVYIDSKGEILWDITLGDYQLINNPHCSYVRLLDDGLVLMRGHVVTDDPEKDNYGYYNDPEYKYWEGWINNKGELTQEVSDVVDYSNQDWMKKLEPE